MRFDDLERLASALGSDKKSFHACFPHVHRAYAHFCQEKEDADDQVEDMYSRLPEYVEHLKSSIQVATIRNYLNYIHHAWSSIQAFRDLFDSDAQKRIAKDIDKLRAQYRVLVAQQAKEKRNKQEEEELQRRAAGMKREAKGVQVVKISNIKADDVDVDVLEDDIEPADDVSSQASSAAMSVIEASLHDINDKLTAMHKKYEAALVENTKLKCTVESMRESHDGLKEKIAKVLQVYIKEDDVRDMINTLMLH
jgi:hypothetical protein